MPFAPPPHTHAQTPTLASGGLSLPQTNTLSWFQPPSIAYRKSQVSDRKRPHELETTADVLAHILFFFFFLPSSKRHSNCSFQKNGRLSLSIDASIEFAHWTRKRERGERKGILVLFFSNNVRPLHLCLVCPRCIQFNQNVDACSLLLENILRRIQCGKNSQTKAVVGRGRWDIKKNIHIRFLELHHGLFRQRGCKRMDDTQTQTRSK